MLWEMLKDREALHTAVDGVSKVKHDSATEEIFSKQKGLPPHTIQPTGGGGGTNLPNPTRAQPQVTPNRNLHKTLTHQGKKSKGRRNSTSKLGKRRSQTQ